MGEDGQPAGQQLDATDPAEVERIAKEFTCLYHELRDQTLGRTRWMGISVTKTPTDLLVLQEIIAETRPTLIVETGVFAGGSALYAASLLDALGIDGKVVGVDVDLSPVAPHIARHPRIELIEGSSTAPEVVSRLREEAADRRVMVDLDSDHRAEHVLMELRELAPLVSPGCYLVVEDTWFGGRPVRTDQGPGPAGALEAWLADGQPFEVDRWRERFLLTGNAGGYLRRLGKDFGGPPRLDKFAVATSRPDPRGAADAATGTGGARDREQQRRYAHEDEFNSLRGYVARLEQELEELRGRGRRRGEFARALGDNRMTRGAAAQETSRSARVISAAKRLPGRWIARARAAYRRDDSPGR